MKQPAGRPETKGRGSTPKVVRIRKRFLDPHERKRQSRKMEAA